MDKTPELADSQALNEDRLTTSDTQVVLVVKTIQSTASCPCCHQPTSRVHSHYQRLVADLPWQGVSVQLQLLTRKFFCINQSCLRRIFCERLPKEQRRAEQRRARRLASYQQVWELLVLQRQELREPDDEPLVQRMAQHPDLAEAIELAQSFAFLVRNRQSDQLDPWLEQAQKSQLSPFHRFAKRLREDYESGVQGCSCD